MLFTPVDPFLRSTGLKKTYFTAVVLFLLLVLSQSSSAQLETNCENSNFSYGNFARWEGCYGIFGNNGNTLEPCEYPGFHPQRHVIIPAPGTYDSHTCDSLITVYPGELYSARLGDTQNGGHAEQLKYTLDVTSDSYLFIYRYAVVLEDPSHPPHQQPAFKIEIQGPDGTVLDSTCGYYYVFAQPGLPGWHACGNVYWKDWTTVGMDMTPYVGQTVKVVFTTRGCCFSAHFGYAYINTYCSKLNLDVALCEGDTNAVLTAPPGFYYEWSTLNGDTTINGNTTASITIGQPVTGDEYFCKLTSYNGCEVTISQLLSYTIIHAGFETIDQCAGLPTNFYDTSTVTQNNVENWKWDFGDGTPILEGEQNPVHIFNNPGIYDVTLISFSTEGCSDTATIPIAIDSLPNVNNDTLRKAICSHSGTDIPLTGAVSNTLFTWSADCGTTDISGYADNSTPAAYLNDTLINVGATIDSVLYTVTPHNNDCSGFDTLYTVLVYPLPILANTTLVKSICDSASTSVDLESNNDTTRFTWTCSASSANVTGYTENTATPDTLINQILRNTGYDIDTVYYHILPQSYGCYGDTIIYKVAVYPVPDLSNSPANMAICNGQVTNLPLQSNVNGTTFSWVAYASSINLSGFSNNPGPGTTSINQTLSNSGYAIDTVTYRLLPLANGCPGDSTDYRVVVFPTPDLSNTTVVEAQCNNVQTNITLTSNVDSTLFTWRAFATTANITGFSGNTGPADTLITQTLVNSGYTIDTVYYRLVPHANGCAGDSVDFKVAVFPVPDVSNSPLFSELCNGTSTNIALLSNVAGANFSWTATPSSANIIGWGPGSGLLIDQVLTNTGFVLENVTYHITPTANGCVGPTIDFVATVVSLPDVYFDPSAQTICSEDTSNIQVLSHVTSATFTWTALESSPNLSGFSNGSGPLIKQPITNSGNTIETVTYTATPEAFGCPAGIPQSVILTVNPTPHVTTTPLSQSICTETATNIPLTSTVSGSTFNWTTAASSGNLSGFSDGAGSLIAQTIANSGFTTETVTYTITPTANSCQGPDSLYTVTVFPRPDMANDPPDTAICNGQPTGVTLDSHVSGTQFTWTATGSSPFISGFSGNTTPTTLLDQTLSNSGYDIEWATYQITPEANGCDGFDTNFVVTVYPVPDVSNVPMNKEICNNNNTDVDLTSHIAATLFTWTATGSSTNIIGFSDNPTPSTHIGDNLINLGDINETVTYHITPHANGCDGITVDYTITIVPSPYLTNSPLDTSICNGQPTGLTLHSNVSGTQFSWTCTPSSANITGYANSTTPGTLINQTLINAGFDNESVIYHVTPENSGCQGSMTDYTVTVFPVPDVYFVPSGETICEGQVTGLSLLSHVTGTAFSWTATASSFNLAGYSDGSGDLIAQTIDNNGATIEWVTYQVTPTANGCPPGLTMPVIATVNPLPVIINATTHFEICNSTMTGIGLQADVSGSTFAWRAFSSSPNITGFSDGSGFIIAHTLSNSGYEIDSVSYRVAASANGCTGDSTDFIVVVFPVTDVIFTPASQALCSGETTGFTITSNVAGTSFTWTATGSSMAVSGYSGGSGTLIQQTLTNSGYLIPTVTYQVTPVANGCIGTLNSVVVAVNPWPVVSLSVCYDTLLTIQSTPFTLKGENPHGGIFSGTGVSGGRFFPAIADTGRHTITYYYSNTYGCDAMDSIHITVVEPVAHSCGDTVYDIRDNRSYPTVLLGTQCWMAKNLNYGNVTISSQVQRDNCIPEKYCINDNPANCTTYGGLYQWNEIMQYTSDNSAQGFCPSGWHLPTETDWNTLFNFYVSNGFAGNALKPTGYSGFNALLEGIRFHNSVWKFRAADAILNSTMFWSSTQHGQDKAWAHGMNEVVNNTDYTPSVSFYPSQHINAFSGRCLKD